eukprot:TRINITY_DN5616_c0_g2_i1.p2 TRINITY_DN5616_c0_g2~~TRINITY_DN5616_c0_g2_i1.p2  ORF type:complete len:699 (+),score=158.74 TRINITY_DN5616_c0_g2_i1:102-2099(+)
MAGLLRGFRVGSLVTDDDQVESAGPAPRRVTIVTTNDVYKLVSLPKELSYFHLRADLSHVANVTKSYCDGQSCGTADGLKKCGKGELWEACFPLSFDAVQELSMKKADHNGPKAIMGPCGAGGQEGSSARYKPGTSETFGGLVDFAATYRWLKEEAEEKGDLAVGTFPGDFIAPSYLAEIYRGKQLVEIMSHMGVDLVDIGNHDIDYGLPVIREQMRKSAFHWLNANLEGADGSAIQQPIVSAQTVQGNDFRHDVSEWRHVQAFGQGWAMLNRSGVKVCILGTTDVDKMNWKGKKVNGFDRDIPAAIAIMKEWRERNLGCSVQIAMTHTRTGNDLNLFHAVEASGFHLDAIVGGHDHYAAFAELTRTDGGVTHMVKTGADARIIAKLTFDLDESEEDVKVQGSKLELVPVVAGACKEKATGERKPWFDKTTELFNKYVKLADEANQIPLNLVYKGRYDTSAVRDGESRASNMWLDLMRESLAGDVLFFQAGCIRQDLFQDFGKGGIELSKLFMLEEFPWGDEDGDSRSSLFPFLVSVEDLVTKTLPFLARKYWCNAPFNDANRIHISGLVIEMTSGVKCPLLSTQELLRSITFVGNCHQLGGLAASLDDKGGLDGCCRGELCGRLWTKGAWDPRLTPELRKQRLRVLTGRSLALARARASAGRRG